MAKKVYWYDGFLDQKDLEAIKLILKSETAKLAGISKCFDIPEQHEDFRADIESAASLRIHSGARSPIIKCASSARDYVYEDLVAEPELGYAWDQIYETAKQNGKLTLLCAGSMTNIALAFLRYRDLSKYIERIIFLAGTRGIGDNTAMAEQSAALDVYALKIILDSNAALLYIGTGDWDTKRITPKELVACGLNIEKLETSKVNMDIETVVCDQFARLVMDFRIHSKADRNVEYYFITDKMEDGR